MTVTSVKSAGVARSKGADEAGKVRKPFDDARRALSDKKVSASLEKMKGLPVSELARAIKRDLPKLAKPMGEMIGLLDHPDQILKGIPDRADATRVATEGWALLDKLVDKTEPKAPGGGWAAKGGSTAQSHNQLVNLLKSELGR